MREAFIMSKIIWVGETDLTSVWYKENLLQTNVKSYEALVINPKPQKDQVAINEITLKINGNEIH